ncbi:hypothetical protein ABZ590_13850, partial [Streptomyces hirsutus]|uniref:hypothetical protein n=1 Tax=Streptomyces hirsutus TaxID=35620 RepID=UPI0034941592
MTSTLPAANAAEAMTAAQNRTAGAVETTGTIGTAEGVETAGTAEPTSKVPIQRGTAPRTPGTYSIRSTPEPSSVASTATLAEPTYAPSVFCVP